MATRPDGNVTLCGGGYGNGNGLALRKGFSNGPGGGVRVTRMPSGGEFSKRLPMALIIEESRKIPQPARTTVFVPNGDQAKPKRGAKFQIEELVKPPGTPLSPATSKPSGAFG